MPLDIRIRFGRAIRRIQEEQGINQDEAAERCGMHRTYYSGIERGVRNVSLVKHREDRKSLANSSCSRDSSMLCHVFPTGSGHRSESHGAELRPGVAQLATMSGDKH
jgi:DNA-binding XRE family transcriptional regulator